VVAGAVGVVLMADPPGDRRLRDLVSRAQPLEMTIAPRTEEVLKPS